MIVDRLDSVNAKQRLLGHLLFIIGVHHTAHDDSPSVRLDRDVRPGEIRADIGGGSNSFFKGCFTNLHDGVLERVFDGGGEKHTLDLSAADDELVNSER